MITDWNNQWDQLGDDDEAYGRSYAEFLSQALESPLINIPLIKLGMALKKQKSHPSIRPSASLKQETEFIESVQKTSKTPKAKWQSYYSCDLPGLVEMMLSNPLDPKLEMETPASAEIYQTFAESMAGLIGVRLDTNQQLSASTNRYYRAHCSLRTILDLRRARSSTGDNSTLMIRAFNQEWHVSNRFFTVTRGERRIYGSFEIFLMIQDVIRKRYAALLAIDVIKKPGLTVELAECQMKWQFTCLTLYGNQGFELSKAPESLWKCWVSRISGGSYSSNDAYDRMIDKQAEKERSMSGTLDSPLIIALDMLIRTVVDIDVAVEMFGIIKVSGHPIIDPEVGGQSAMEFGTAADKSVPSSVVENLAIIQHLLLKNYLEAKGVWPDMVFSSKTTSLFDLWQRGVTALPDGSYPLTDWDHTSISKIFDFNFHEDYLNLIQDKSCAPPLSALKKFYEGRDIDKAQRRVLAVMLAKKDVNTRQLISEFARNALSDDEFNILLYPKECEFKLAARMFCMLSFSIRLIFSIIQENVKDSVFKLLPYQSMTMDQNELTTKLLAMTESSAHKETLFIEVDLSRWNLNFRPLLMEGLGKILDMLFGVCNVFGRTHEIFERSLVSVFIRDLNIASLNAHSPDLQSIENSGVQWRGHLGGFEGIDQATWTIATIGMIYKALWNEKCSFILLGQGDNQTLAITRYGRSTESMESFSNRIMQNIETSCKNLNHVAKPEEFIDSTTVLTYSKVFIVRGRIVPMEVKFAMNIAPITASEIPAIGEALGAIYSAAIGSATNSHEPSRLWLLALMHAEDCLTRFAKRGAWFGPHAKELGFSRLKLDQKKILLTLPSILGGFPICSWINFFIRQEPDPLGSAIASVQFLARSDHLYGRVLTFLTRDDSFRSGEVSLDKLLEDPYSIPLTNPPTQKSHLERAALEALRSRTVNKDIRELINAGGGAAADSLKASLLSMRPLFPTLAMDLYKISAPGKFESIAKLFTLTRTFVAFTKSGSGILNSLLSAEIRSASTVLRRVSGLTLLNPITTAPYRSTYDFCEALRLRWGLGPNTIQGLSTSHPLDFCFSTSAEQSHGVRAVFVGDYAAERSSRGSLRPYLGGKTTERRTGAAYAVKPAPGSEELKKLVIASGAGAYDTNMQQLFRLITSTRTQMSLEHLQAIYPTTIGGVIAHRYEQMNTDGRIAAVGNPNLATFITFNTDDIPNLSKSKIDYPVAFQQYFAFSVMAHRLVQNYDPTRVSRVVSIGLSIDGLPALTPELIRVETLPKIVVPDSLQTNRLLFVRDLEIIPLSIPTDRSITRVAQVENFFGSKKNRLLLVTNLLMAEASKKSVLGDRIDSNELRPLRLRTVDAIVFDSLGSEVFYKGSVRAISALTVMSYLKIRGPEENRYSLTGLIEKWAGILMDIWGDHVSRKGANISFIRTKKSMSVGMGQRGVTSTNLRLMRSLITASLKLTIKAEKDWLLIDPIVFARTSPRPIGSIILSSFSLALWTVLARAPTESSVGEIKKQIRNMIVANVMTASSSASEEVIYQAEARRIAEIVSDNSTVSDTDVIRYMARLTEDKVAYIDLGTEEVWRALRNIPPVDLLVPEPSFSYVLEGSGTTGELGIDMVPIMPAQHNLMEFLNPTDITLADRLWRSAGKSIGLWSTAGGDWANVPMESCNGPFLVVGTGAGGVQTLLASRGLESFGLDLQESLPAEVIGKCAFVLPEAARFNTSLPKVSEVAELSSGDALDPLVLEIAIAKVRPRTIIFDAEASSFRHGLRFATLLTALQLDAYVMQKMFLSEEELSAVIGCLSCSHKVTSVGAHLLDKGKIGDLPVSEIVICYRLRPGSQIATSWNQQARITSPASRVPARPATNSDSERKHLLSVLTGDSFVAPSLDLREMIENYKQFVYDAQGEHRGATSSSLFAATITSMALIIILLEVEAQEDALAGIRLIERYLNQGVTIMVKGKKFVVTRASPGFETMMTKVMPRFLPYDRSLIR